LFLSAARSQDQTKYQNDVNQEPQDVIVVGLGAMGSATAFHLAAKGARVLGFDRYHPPHQFGSSHGLTRIIREAYFEHPSYVPLVQRAYELWADLEQLSGRKLLRQTGGLMIGPPDGVLVSGARRSAEEHKLLHQVFSSAELRARFPIFSPEENTVGIWEPRAGILFPELAVQTHLELAVKRGASLKFNESVLRWEPEGEGVRVFTDKGVYRAGRLVLSAGAWLGALLGGPADLPLSVERQVLLWFEPRAQAELFQPEHCPIYIWEYAPHRFFYGFPDLGDGIKAAVHHEGQRSDPETIQREVSEHEVETMRSLLRRFLPDADGVLKSSVVCMYTNTPDEHFLLDYHPAHPLILVASPCSGHGFKFSSVIGELAATLLASRQPSFDLSLFRIKRFAGVSPAPD
jgi:sarcosine oxidase